MIAILWDASHIWGYLLLHAVRSTGIPFRVLKGLDIAQSGLSGKMLMVPGGSARRKAEALGTAGMEEVRRFVHGGGRYIGFCGGAGLALSENLGLCPWKRDGMTDRLQHLVSGHFSCSLTSESALVPPGLSGKTALLPVWWPGRFNEPEKNEGVDVLARYRAPGPDLYVADLPYASMPADILAEWNAMYGVTLRPSLLDGRPCAVAGTFGRGSWLLSYSHLETPADFPGSEHAGTWLLHVLRSWCEPSLSMKALPPLDFDALPVLWEDAALLSARDALATLIRLAKELGLLFPRNRWLLGWRSGVPGAQFNSLNAALSTALSLTPDARRLRLWNERRSDFEQAFSLFAQGARSWLLARRLADTLADSAPGMLPRELLVDQRRALFGSPMFGGGLSEQILDMLENLV
ncbi:BPL-N domain-containing protein [Mailhella massiliensis]|uniref:BPL-N domain-containing protein n=1 Tax=Mailhella massiliensis TaxID=1903261 RepID=A0A921DT20_9BACT|nr:BPL-N domain-containing protein [Mailhella massiliensis]HJD97607.1 BPL-N domain-containing protein [Mailhella massiliensis]